MSPSFAAALTADADIATCFTPEAELSAMVAFETALASAEAARGLIPAAAAAAIASACAGFQPDMAALAAGLRQDGVLGPSL